MQIIESHKDYIEKATGLLENFVIIHVQLYNLLWSTRQKYSRGRGYCTEGIFCGKIITIGSHVKDQWNQIKENTLTWYILSKK